MANPDGGPRKLASEETAATKDLPPEVTMEKVLNYLIDVGFSLHKAQVGNAPAVETFKHYMGFYPPDCEPDTEEDLDA
jgi:hypothetical protein